MRLADFLVSFLLWGFCKTKSLTVGCMERMDPEPFPREPGPEVCRWPSNPSSTFDWMCDPELVISPLWAFLSPGSEEQDPCADPF